MALSPFQEAQAVRRALTRALEVAAHDFLVDCAGQDLADNMVILEDYNFEVHQLTKTSFMVRAKHRERQAMALQIEVKVSGS